MATIYKSGVKTLELTAQEKKAAKKTPGMQAAEVPKITYKGKKQDKKKK